MNPLVTVNILSFNRKNELRNTLQKVYEQSYKNIEVIVVDNASHDGSADMVDNEFPLVQVIKLKNNIGIAGWNEGFKIAKGEFILVLDDDSYPESNALCNALNFMNKNSEFGIAAFTILNHYTDKNETEHLLGKTNYFIGCGALIRKKLLDEIGYFNEDYFIYNHELDFSIRAINRNWGIELLADAIVIHNQSMKSRGAGVTNPLTSVYRFKNESITYSIFLVQNFSFPMNLLILTKWILNRTIVAVIHLYFIDLTKILFRIIWSLPKWLSRKNNINRIVQIKFNYGNIPLIDKNYFPNFSKEINRIRK